MRTFWLSMHASYACRHAGACCSAGWDIPLEATRAAAITPLAPRHDWLRAADGAPAEVAGILAVGETGHCVFHQRGCEIHRVLGHEALPAACQHFPRECLIDPRGVFVTLSHFCPTATDMLFEHSGPVAIVEGPPALPGGDPEGLDARDALPPLLTAGVLMDLDGYSAWEAHAVGILAGNPAGAWLPEQALAALRHDARNVSRWRPGNGPLSAAVDALATRGGASGADAPVNWLAEHRAFEIARDAQPPPHRWPAYPPDGMRIWQASVAPAWPTFAVVIGRFLAAHAFASWMAYQGTGLVAWTRRLDLALAVLRAEALRACAAGGPLTTERLGKAMRQTDLLVVHLCDRAALARGISAAPA